MNHVEYYDLKPGDKIVVPKSWIGVIEHHAVYLGQNYLGEQLIGENVAGASVRVVSSQQFFAVNHDVTRIERFHGTNIERRLAIERALEKLDQPYNLINFNCEHFVNYVQKGVVKSNQVGWGLFILAILAIAAIVD